MLSSVMPRRTSASAAVFFVVDAAGGEDAPPRAAPGENPRQSVSDAPRGVAAFCATAIRRRGRAPPPSPPILA
jgi:hypothetical protein